MLIPKARRLTRSFQREIDMDNCEIDMTTIHEWLDGGGDSDELRTWIELWENEQSEES
jgi:hypothetical protein